MHWRKKWQPIQCSCLENPRDFFLQPPSQPFLEMEQLRLAKQLEGLQARLGLGTKEDMTPELNYGVWEEGRDPENRQVGQGLD